MRYRSRRPSPAMVVAMLALVLAGAGTASANGAVGLIAKELGLTGKQKKQIASIADKQIAAKAPTLSVASATDATDATNATNATNAANATALGGFAASAFASSSHFMTYDQTVTATGTGGASGTGVVTLASVGPFTIVGKCTSYSGGSAARTYIRSTQSNTAVTETEGGEDTTDLTPTTNTGQWQQGGTDVPGDDPIGPQAVGTSASPSFAQSTDGPSSAISGDRQTRLVIQPVVGSYVGAATAPACTFYGYIISS